MLIVRNYNELQRLKTFEERFDYLRLSGYVGKSTFGFDRYLNQMLYRSRRWARIRDLIIIRDSGCDLGILDRFVIDKVVIHHMNPITKRDIEINDDKIYEPEFLICTSSLTHRAIHYGDKTLLPRDPIKRYSGDTIPWKHK